MTEIIREGTQNQAISAILFLYRHILERPIDGHLNIDRALKPKKTPVVFTPDEVQQVLNFLEWTYWLMAFFLYGSGLRLMECIRFRIKDVEFVSKHIIIQDGKGFKDLVTMLP